MFVKECTCDTNNKINKRGLSGFIIRHNNLLTNSYYYFRPTLFILPSNKYEVLQQAYGCRAHEKNIENVS